jgi:hypothetical protein
MKEEVEFGYAAVLGEDLEEGVSVVQKYQSHNSTVRGERTRLHSDADCQQTIGLSTVLLAVVWCRLRWMAQTGMDMLCAHCERVWWKTLNIT